MLQKRITPAICLYILLTVLLAAAACRSRSGTDKSSSQSAQLDMITETGETAENGSGNSATETRIKGAFKGWSGETLFLLNNGQLWKQCAYGYYYSYAYNPEISIINDNGGQYLQLKGKEEKVKVCRISGYSRTRVNGSFKGWKGNTVVKLINGGDWRQAEPYISVSIEIMPEVILYEDGGMKMWIAGTDKAVRVMRH